MIIPYNSLYNSMLLGIITHQEQKHLKPYSSVNRLKTGGLKGFNRSKKSKSYKKVKSGKTFKTI